MQTPTIVLEPDFGRAEPGSPPEDPKPESPGPRPAWPPAMRVLFRFAFAYLVIYILPFPLSDERSGAYASLWDDLVPRVGRWAYGVEITIRPNGSGDTTYSYVQVSCFAALAVVVAAAWTLLDRRRTAYPTLHHWLRVYVRFYLAVIMFSYGSVKVIQSQFPAPRLDRLLQPFGDASPMGLLWTFMGASAAYNVFTGAGEILGGLLLTTRRTTLLGALVCFGVLSHVTMLNFSYDVPVKLFSIHLLAMSLFLMAPDLGRLARIFVLNRPVEPAPIRPLSRWPWVNGGAYVLRTVLVGYVLFMDLQGARESRKRFGDLMTRSSLYGIWDVEAIEVDGKPRPPLITDAERWRRVVFDYPKSISVQLMNDSRLRYGLELDEKAMAMALSKREDPAWKPRLAYTRPEPDRLEVEGKLDGRKIKARLRRVDAPEFRLIARGFHWINEYPYNR